VLYYGLCRRFRPSVVLEIGAGFSTHIALHAAERNGATSVRCIEPYPSPSLSEITHRLGRLWVEPVQSVPMDAYADLQAGDVLFVYSSHVSKIGSDVNHILFHVLPALSPGVFVHFHDIFLPREYPQEWVARNWFWNEQYVLLAFLMYNRAFRVMFMSSHFLHTSLPLVERTLAWLPVRPFSGGSLWLRKEE